MRYATRSVDFGDGQPEDVCAGCAADTVGLVGLFGGTVTVTAWPDVEQGEL